MKVIAVDPGGYTGLATYSAVVMPDGTHHEIKWWSGYLGKGPHHAALRDFLELQISDQDTRLIVEAFDFRQSSRTGLELISREYIGICRLVAADFSRQVTYKPQKPPERNWASHARLAKLGLLQRPVSTKPNKDINDALQHLVTYLAAELKLIHILQALRGVP